MELEVARQNNEDWAKSYEEKACMCDYQSTYQIDY